MPVHERTYTQWYDANGAHPVPSQVDNPASLEFLPAAAANRRVIVGSDNNPYAVADAAVSPRGSKQIIWSSEGYTYNGVQIPALTATQKKASGSSATNIALATAPNGVTLPTTLDLSPFKNLTLVLNLSAITGTSIQFELDTLDDSATPVVLPIWKPAALTAAGANLVSVGPGVNFPPVTNSLPTGFAGVTVPANWSYSVIPITFPPNGQIVWTATSVTSATWTVWLYGSY